jgi:hypothetical protein
MGWGRTLLLGDIGNRLDIADTERDVERLKQEISRAFRMDMSQDEKIEALIRENGELKLYLASLVRLLVSNGSVSKAELQAMVAAVDAEDGKADGRCDGGIV